MLFVFLFLVENYLLFEFFNDRTKFYHIHFKIYEILSDRYQNLSRNSTLNSEDILSDYSKKVNFVPWRRLAGTRNLILFSTYAFAYDCRIENSRLSDKILFSYQAIATTVHLRDKLIIHASKLIWVNRPGKNDDIKIIGLRIENLTPSDGLDSALLNKCCHFLRNKLMP